MSVKRRVSTSKMAGLVLRKKFFDNFSVWAVAVSFLSLASFMGLAIGTDIINSNNVKATGAESNMSATVETTLSLAIQNLSSETIDTVSADIQNGNSGVTNTAKVIAGTNSANGYSLTLADSDNITDLAPYNSSTGTYDITGSKISPISGDMPLASFGTNTWGYAVVYSNTNTDSPTPPSTFSPITTEEVTLYTEVDEPGVGYHYFTAAAKVRDALPAGTYEDELVFSLTAVAPPAPTTTCTIGSGDCMQDIGTVCPNLATGNTVTLTDARDGQEYTVFKANDGNCWMGENLRYGVNPDGTAHPFVAEDVTLSDDVNSTKMQDLTYDSTSPNDAGRIKNGTSDMKTADGLQSAFAGIGDNFTEPYINIYQANDVANYDGQTKYGVHYNYCAATGGTACTDALTDYSSTGSICPTGWELPGIEGDPTGSGADPSGATKTYDNMLNAYGVTNSSAGYNIVVSAPLLFVRAGDSYNGILSNRSSTGSGRYWSSTAYDSSSAVYYFFLGRYSVNRSESDRCDGQSVRCVSS